MDAQQRRYAAAWAIAAAVVVLAGCDDSDSSEPGADATSPPVVSSVLPAPAASTGAADAAHAGRTALPPATGSVAAHPPR